MPTAMHVHRPAHVLRSQPVFPSHSPNRPIPTRSATYPSEKSEAPWQHMAHTYTWVVGQEFLAHDKRDRKTEQWILEQQIFLAADSSERRSARGLSSQRKMWEEVVYSYEIDAERWMRHEEDTRRRAAEREREKTRLIQEELRRVEARIRYKREAERRKIAEEKARIYEELRERERRNKVKTDKAMMAAWSDYEKLWSNLPTSSESLTFSSIPWPVVSPPLQAEDLTSVAISSFLFSPLHSQNQTRKERIRSAQLRWHPDRFQRVLGKVRQEDKAQVQEGVGIVARCLNEMMARETTVSRQMTR